MQITPAQYQTTLTAFINADGDANAARSATLAASQSFQETKDLLAGWLQETRNVLAARFGSRWSTM